MIRAVYHGDLNEVQGDAELRNLLSAPAARAPFDRLEWWQALADKSPEETLIAVAKADGVCGALPLRRAGNRIECLANWYTFRVAPCISPAADRAELLTAIAQDLIRQTGQLLLSPLPDEHGETRMLAKALRDTGWITFVEQCDINHVLPVGGRSYADYLASRPGPLRTTLKRKAKKVRIEIHSAFRADSWAAYEAIYAESWKGAEGDPAMLRTFASQEGAAGRLRLGLAYAGAQAVAAQLWTVEQGTAYIHKLAYAEAARPLSAGTTLTAALMEHVMDQDRVELVDFGTGDDPYKRDWMEQARPRFRIAAYRPERPANWPMIARKRLRRLVREALHD